LTAAEVIGLREDEEYPAGSPEVYWVGGDG
jgi:hypothetical protein